MTSVAQSYAHRDKHCIAGAGLTVGGAQVKWYEIAPKEVGVPADIAALARAFLQREQGALGGDLGFVILHRCGADFFFLLVSVWRSENELWETVYAKQKAVQADFALFPQPGPQRGTFCVWELGAVAHEKDAWRRYLRTARDEPAKAAYLADVFEGAV